MFFTRFFPILTKLKALKTHGRLLWHAFRHTDTPKWIKGFMLAVVVYLFSPIDLIPDFLVFFGITDDLVVISAAMWFLGKVVPEKVKQSFPVDKLLDNPNNKTSILKPFGLILLVGLLIAALANHPWVQARLFNIEALF